jgi:hypothetical protein
MRGVRAVIVCLLAVLAFSGWTRATAAVAAAQPRNNLTMTCGQSYVSPSAVAHVAAPMPSGDTVPIGERWF